MDLSSLKKITLNEQTNYRLNEINEIKNYFKSEIKDQELLTKKLSKYITVFDYCDKILTVFLTISTGVNISSHVKTEKHTGLIISVSSLISCLNIGKIKKSYCMKQRKERKNIINYFI